MRGKKRGGDGGEGLDEDGRRGGGEASLGEKRRGEERVREDDRS